jgi:hypothetical protein
MFLLRILLVTTSFIIFSYTPNQMSVMQL